MAFSPGDVEIRMSRNIRIIIIISCCVLYSAGFTFLDLVMMVQYVLYEFS